MNFRERIERRERLTLGVALVALVLMVSGMGSARATTGVVGPSALPGNANSQFGPYVRPVPTWTDNLVFASATTQTWSVPTGAKWVSFGATCQFYVSGVNTAAVPGGTTSDGSGMSISPTAFYIQPGISQLSIIPASATCVIGIDVYRNAN